MSRLERARLRLRALVVEAEFPAEALKAKRLKQETMSFGVSIAQP